jgi:hypothetical protein
MYLCESSRQARVITVTAAVLGVLQSQSENV